MKGLQEDYLPVSASKTSYIHTPRDRRLTAFKALAAVALLYLSIDTFYALTHDPFYWKGCSDDPHYLCGYLTVPLDYTNSSDPRTAEIATVLYQQKPGHKTARTLVIEPGGPGGSGTAMLWAKGKTFGEMYTDGQYDVLGFDPRGVNQSTPSISCFSSDVYRDRWQWTAHQWPEASGIHTIDRLDAMNQAIMEACEQQYEDLPRFLTTAFVARDVDAIREALGEDELTGFMVSYGTGIGQTYAQMFPDKVGRLALDGMEFAKDGWQPWAWGTTSLGNVTNAFEDGIIGECIKAGPDQCTLAKEAVLDDAHYLTLHADLAERLHNLFYGLIERPISGHSSHGPGIITYEYLTSWLYSILYHPADWKASAEILASLENGNATSALEAISDDLLWSYKPGKEGKDPNSGELESTVLCGDAYDAEQKSLDWWKELHDDMIETSWISGTPRLYATLPCRHFKWEVAEVYRGEFNHTLKNPLLLIGGPYDPATPLRNARRLAKEMGDNAKLIVHHGYGHSSARDPSACTQERVRAFMLNGTLPEKPEVDCYADSKPFDVGFWGLT